MANTNNSRKAAATAERRTVITVTRFLLSPLYGHTCAVEVSEAEQRGCCQNVQGTTKIRCSSMKIAEIGKKIN